MLLVGGPLLAATAASTLVLLQTDHVCMSVHEPLRGWCAEPGSPSVVNAGSLPAPTLRVRCAWAQPLLTLRACLLTIARHHQVSQLDSALLDDELAFVLRDKFLRVCQHLRMCA